MRNEAHDALTIACEGDFGSDRYATCLLVGPIKLIALALEHAQLTSSIRNALVDERPKIVSPGVCPVSNALEDEHPRMLSSSVVIL